MIKINLAATPGLQQEPKDIAISQSLKDILIKMAVEPKNQPIDDQAISESSTKPIPEKVEKKTNVFASQGSNSSIPGGTDAEEPIPQPPPKISDKLREAEQIIERKEEEYSKHLFNRPILNIGIWILVLVIVGALGYWGYTKYFNPRKSAITAKPAGKSDLPVEQPILLTEQSQPSSTSDMPEVDQPVLTPINQIDEIYLPPVLTGISRCQILSQLISVLPDNSRIQFLKLDKDVVNFLIFVDTENEAQQVKDEVQKLPGIGSIQAFYIEHIADTPSPAVQMMAILNLKTESAVARNIRFYDDVSLSQVLWAIGKRQNLKLQPLNIAEPPAPKPRLAEIRGNGSLNSIINLLSELSNFDLNLSVEKIAINLSADSAVDTGILDFSINSVIYPQKL